MDRDKEKMIAPSRQFFIYVGVQILAYALEMGTFIIARALEYNLILSNSCAKFLALVVAFVLHRHVTFSSTTQSAFQQGANYFVLFLFNVSAATGLLWLLKNYMPETAAKFISDTVLIVLSFALARLFVFKTNSIALVDE